MKPISSLIQEEQLEKMASRSNWRYGKQIAEKGEITFIETNTYKFIAQIKYRGNETRNVEAMSTPKGLRWKCTCSSRKDLFCQHCIAAGLSFIKLLTPPQE